MTESAALSLDGMAAPPMVNGEVTFDAPWQGRVFGMAHALADRGVFVWDDFRACLIERIAAWESAHPEGEGYPYYDCFLEALERVLAEKRIVHDHDLSHRIAELGSRPHDHDHHHGDHHHD